MNFRVLNSLNESIKCYVKYRKSHQACPEIWLERKFRVSEISRLESEAVKDPKIVSKISLYVFWVENLVFALFWLLNWIKQAENVDGVMSEEFHAFSRSLKPI